VAAVVAQTVTCLALENDAMTTASGRIMYRRSKLASHGMHSSEGAEVSGAIVSHAFYASSGCLDAKAGAMGLARWNRKNT
jgi:hypothetical protein